MIDTKYIEIIDKQEKEINDLKERIKNIEEKIFTKNIRNAGRNAIFSYEDKMKIIERYNELQSSRKVAEEFGVSKGTILKIIKEK
ncbi:MAG: hypothetical protein RSE41_06680 [Clostridia bacterium]